MDYSKSKIYTIRCKTDESLIYVGSTIQLLCQRLAKHKYKSKTHPQYTLYNEINNNWDEWYIELYENYPCSNKEELLKREGEVIREIGTLNNKIAGRTTKTYYNDNTYKIKEYKHQYCIEKADKIKEYKHQYYIENADKIKEKVKQYRITKKNQNELI